MQADREEWLKQQARLAEKGPKHNGAASSHITNMLQQASIKQENLTNDDNWNYYLTLIQSWVEKTILNAEQFREALESPDLVNPDDRKKLENYLMICNERVSTLMAVIALPKQIIDDYANASLDIEEIPDIKYDA